MTSGGNDVPIAGFDTESRLRKLEASLPRKLLPDMDAIAGYQPNTDSVDPLSLDPPGSKKMNAGDSLELRVEKLEALRPRKLLPDMDAIDEMVQRGTRLITEIQEIVDGLKSRGGIEIIVEPQAPTQVNVPTIRVTIPLK